MDAGSVAVDTIAGDLSDAVEVRLWEETVSGSFLSFWIECLESFRLKIPMVKEDQLSRLPRMKRTEDLSSSGEATREPPVNIYILFQCNRSTKGLCHPTRLDLSGGPAIEQVLVAFERKKDMGGDDDRGSRARSKNK
jgi:hypothetical protein